MAYDQHLIIQQETVWGTFVTPTHAFPIYDFEVDPGQEFLMPQVTGSGRAARQRTLGAKAVSGSLSLPWWPEKMVHILKAAGFYDVATTTPVGATTARLHGCLPSDATDPLSFCAQAKYNASFAHNIRGGIINTLTMTFNNKGYIDLAADWLALDEVVNDGGGDLWTDGTAAPAIVATPSYFSQALRPFTAFDVAINLGGTPALDDPSNVISLTGSAANTTFESLELTIENSMSMQHRFNQSRIPASRYAGGRVVTLSGDIDWSVPVATWYDYHRAGTYFAVEIVATGAIIEAALAYQVRVVLPRCQMNTAPVPAMSGTLDRPVQSIELVAIEDPTTGYDVNIVVQDTQTSYAS